MLAAATGLLAAFTVAIATPSLASDYQHSCRTADGGYFMQDGALFEASAPDKFVPYRTLKRSVLTRRNGYCLGRVGGKGERRKYGFSFERYLVEVAFRVGAERVETILFCEEASDGLPVSARCEVERVTERFTASLTQPDTVPSSASRDDEDGGSTQASAPAITGRWDHNGSEMKLEARGAARIFKYAKPRSGLRSVGVEPGTVLFRGTKEGERYSGEAYVFTRRCGPRAFTVEGPVSADQQRVTLYGERPRFNRACKRIGGAEETLVFSLGR
ncbi:MAG: hypothetical protein AAFZ05_07125 [Pseudomonadota bacterium]